MIKVRRSQHDAASAGRQRRKARKAQLAGCEAKREGQATDTTTALVAPALARRIPPQATGRYAELLTVRAAAALAQSDGPAETYRVRQFTQSKG